MPHRALMIGLLLTAFHAGVGLAQSTAPSVDSSPAESTIGPDGTRKVPNNVPDVIRAPEPPRPIRSKATTDPRAALEPPPIEVMFLTQSPPRPVEMEIGFRPEQRRLAIFPSWE